MLDNGRDVVIGEKVADGGLAYSANDDCHLVSGDGVVASYTVRAYVREFDRALGTRSQFRCPPTFTAMLSVNNPWLFINAPDLRGEFPVTLVKDVDMEIVSPARELCETSRFQGTSKVRRHGG